jgi:hypothetical protein
MAGMNTYTEKCNGPQEASPAAPRVSADIHPLLGRTETTVPVRTLWNEESFSTLERIAKEGVNLAFKLSSTSDMAQSTDDCLSELATASHIASVSQKVAAKLRSMRCIN